MQGHLPGRVLHVLNSACGGAALSTMGLVTALRERGVISSAVCNDSGNLAEKSALLDSFDGRVAWARLYWWNRKTRARRWKRPLLELAQGFRTGWTLLSTSIVRKAALGFGADLIHTNTFLTPEGGKAAQQLALPHVWHLRELIGPGRPFQLPIEGPDLSRYLKRSASVIVANSVAAAACLQESAGRELNMRVVPNGIDVDRFAMLEPRNPKTLVIGMVANLTSRVKKHRLFIEAAALVAKDLAVEFRIFGHSPKDLDETRDEYVRGLVDRIKELGQTGRFFLKGYIPDPVEIMRGIDVLVHTADEESFGRVVVEAMAAGRPVVGVRGGGVAGLIRDGIDGFLAPPGDPQEIARFVDVLVKDKQRRLAMGEAGRRRVRDEFSLSRCAERMCAVYADAMTRPLGDPRA